ncbi:winged helix-turn-helix domain-containing protein [bacterium]|nr:winged helix-turn-helix domain-containing protein [bacterium]
MSLINFRNEYLSLVLDLIWSQWITIGINGHGKKWTTSVIDPDALLIFSCTFARYDARLFDAIIEWLKHNSHYINITRLKRMMKTEIFEGQDILKAMITSHTNLTNNLKWASLLKPSSASPDKELLFYLPNGKPMPVTGSRDAIFQKFGYIRQPFHKRNVATKFQASIPGCFLLQLRAFLGVNARCEILNLLLSKGADSPRSIARECYYYPATMTKALAEMEDSGYVVSRIVGRRHVYSMMMSNWSDLLGISHHSTKWIVWARLFSALEQIWALIEANRDRSITLLEESSILRRLLNDSVVKQLETTGVPFPTLNVSRYPNESLVPEFIHRLKNMLLWISA